MALDDNAPPDYGRLYVAGPVAGWRGIVELSPCESFYRWFSTGDLTEHRKWRPLAQAAASLIRDKYWQSSRAAEMAVEEGL
jgi:hypothetical protein